MQVNSISFRSAQGQNQPDIKAKYSENKVNEQQKVLKNKESSRKNFFDKFGISEPPPITIGLASTVIWTGFGMLFDKALSKIMKYEFNPKNSFKINIIFGLLMGAFDYFRAKKS